MSAGVDQSRVCGDGGGRVTGCFGCVCVCVCAC